MKPFFKTLLFGLLAIALALGCRYVYLESADVLESGSTTWYEDAMLQAREMFLEKPDAVQGLTALLVEEPAESYRKKADGSFLLRREDKETALPEEIQPLLSPACGDYTNGGEILNIEVTEDAVIFYTCYENGGCAGFLYEKELGGTDYFDYVELVENWKLFYRVAE